VEDRARQAALGDRLVDGGVDARELGVSSWRGCAPGKFCRRSRSEDGEPAASTAVPQGSGGRIDGAWKTWAKRGGRAPEAGATADRP
jgi:hypothetical protein